MLLEQQSLDEYTVIGNLAMEMFLPPSNLEDLSQSMHNICNYEFLLNHREYHKENTLFHIVYTSKIKSKNGCYSQ